MHRPSSLVSVSSPHFVLLSLLVDCRVIGARSTCDAIPNLFTASFRCLFRPNQELSILMTLTAYHWLACACYRWNQQLGLSTCSQSRLFFIIVGAFFILPHAIYAIFASAVATRSCALFITACYICFIILPSCYRYCSVQGKWVSQLPPILTQKTSCETVNAQGRKKS